MNKFITCKMPGLRRILKFLVILNFVFIVSACGNGSGTNSGSIPAELKQNTYYSQVNFWVVNNRHLSENHLSKEMIPVGTPVRLVSVNGRKFIIQLPENKNRQIEIVNIEDRSRHDPLYVFRRMFDATPPSLINMPASAKESVLHGKIVVGMSRGDVLMSRGFPPRGQHRKHDARIWVYWNKVYDKTLVVFGDDDRVEYVF